MIAGWDYRSLVTPLGVEERGSKGPAIVGLGIPYGVWSDDLGGFRERFATGAVSESMKVDDWRSLYNHSSLHVLGRKSAGTLEVWEETDGVHYRAYPPMEADWARGAVASIKRRDVRENSFAFRAKPEHSTWEEKDGMLWRTVLKASVRELGPQTFPAYPQTTTEARSIEAVLEEGHRFLGGIRTGTIDPAVLRLLDQAEDERPNW